MESLVSCCRGHAVLIYGAGIWGRLTAQYFLERDIEVVGFVVSRVNKDDLKSIFGLPIIDVDQLNKRFTTDVKIITAVSEQYRNEIETALKNYGISDYYSILDDEIKVIEAEIQYSNKYTFFNNIDVLLYHRVDNLSLDPRGLSISPENFEKHLKYFAENCSVMRSEEDWSNAENSIVITFDDGHYDFCRNVLPLLEKYKLPATVFISTGNIDENEELWGDELERIVFLNDYSESRFEIWDRSFLLSNNEQRFETMITIRNILKNMSSDCRREKLNELSVLLGLNTRSRTTHRIMTSDEIKRCAESEFVTIGAHTVTHCSLAHETLERQKWEIVESKEKLERITGQNIPVFAYPYGENEDFTDATIDIASSIGFQKIFAVCGGMTSHQYENGRIPRNNVSFCKDVVQLERQLNYHKYVYGKTVD